MDKVERAITSIFITRGDGAESDPGLEELSAKLHEDYDGIVLRDEVISNPPMRGDFGYANIPLKDNAQSTRQKPFVQFGEKNKALKKITQEWIDKEYMERPKKPKL